MRMYSLADGRQQLARYDKRRHAAVGEEIHRRVDHFVYYDNIYKLQVLIYCYKSSGVSVDTNKQFTTPSTEVADMSANPNAQLTTTAYAPWRSIYTGL